MALRACAWRRLSRVRRSPKATFQRAHLRSHKRNAHSSCAPRGGLVPQSGCTKGLEEPHRNEVVEAFAFGSHARQGNSYTYTSCVDNAA